MISDKDMKMALSYADTFYKIARKNLSYRSPDYVSKLTQKLFQLTDDERIDVLWHIERRMF